MIDVRMQRPHLPPLPSQQPPLLPNIPPSHKSQAPFDFAQQQGRWGEGVRDGLEPGGWDVDEEGTADRHGSAYDRSEAGGVGTSYGGSGALAQGEAAATDDDRCWTVEIDLQRVRGGRGSGGGKKGKPRAYAPRFPKVCVCFFFTF